MVDCKPLGEWHQRHPSAQAWRADLSDPVECRRAMEGVLGAAIRGTPPAGDRNE